MIKLFDIKWSESVLLRTFCLNGGNQKFSDKLARKYLKSDRLKTINPLL